MSRERLKTIFIAKNVMVKSKIKQTQTAPKTRLKIASKNGSAESKTTKTIQKNKEKKTISIKKTKNHLELTPRVRHEFEKKEYGIVGNHSGVQICSWNKKALRGEGVCYKQKFYGIDCAKCAQMAPTIAWCQNNCIFCWRPMEWMKENPEEMEVDAPELIIKETIEQRKKLLSGFGGNKKVNQKFFKEALEPNHWAISLSGEPTTYSKLDKLVLKLRENNTKSIFIVTNGQNPKMLKKLQKNHALPTQLYLSISASNKKMFDKVDRTYDKNGWEIFNETINLFPKLNCRKILRLTLIKAFNDGYDEKTDKINQETLKEYAELIEKSKTDFLEIKAYMFLGFSRKRLKENNMPLHTYVKKWGKELEQYLPNYKYIDEQKESRIILLKRKDSPYTTLIDFKKEKKLNLEIQQKKKIK